jgi:hypothetical protein
MSEERYLTVYKGREQRKPRPFSPTEEEGIIWLSSYAEADLMRHLIANQNLPRYQRLVQEAIERKRRANGRG